MRSFRLSAPEFGSPELSRATNGATRPYQLARVVGCTKTDNHQLKCFTTWRVLAGLVSAAAAHSLEKKRPRTMEHRLYRAINKTALGDKISDQMDCADVGVVEKRGTKVPTAALRGRYDSLRHSAPRVLFFFMQTVLCVSAEMVE
uniref:Uncharacterized protein n=1 Tax=Steinernema glaseri TaxID=37863 RepID=A0A1I7YQD8_9BILA